MLVGIASGLGIGLGAYLTLRGLAPTTPDLADRLARHLLDPPSTTADDLTERFGAAVLHRSDRLRRQVDQRAADLRVAGRTPPRHAFEKVATAWVLAALPVVAGSAAHAGAVAVNWALVGVASAAAAVVGFVVPDATLRSLAAERRGEFRQSLVAFLDLASVVVAGGGGPETALHEAARSGDGWCFRSIRSALEGSRLRGSSPWVSLGELGDDLDVPELRELAATVGLAGEQGARVRSSLAAKARSLRERLLAELRAEAEAATERMSVPTALMLFGFVGFVLYPALQFVLEGL